MTYLRCLIRALFPRHADPNWAMVNRDWPVEINRGRWTAV
jgi:hypothetical protein